jgi:hypothetical protein
VEFIKPNLFHCPRLAIGQYDGFADKVRLRLLEFGKNCGRVRSASGRGNISMIAAVAGFSRSINQSW